jgi:hypothetical protein
MTTCKVRHKAALGENEGGHQVRLKMHKNSHEVNIRISWVRIEVLGAQEQYIEEWADAGTGLEGNGPKQRTYGYLYIGASDLESAGNSEERSLKIKIT